MLGASVIFLTLGILASFLHYNSAVDFSFLPFESFPLNLFFSHQRKSCHHFSDTMTQNVQRNVLPGSVVPVHYDLYIKPNLKTFAFEGRISILYASSALTYFPH